MAVRRSVALLVVLNLLAACGGGPPATSPGNLPAPASQGPTAEAPVGADDGTLTGTIVAGEAAGSATVDPFEAAVVQATGPDGSTYRLDIEPASVRHPTVVSLRPLSSVSFAGATLLAGVEIEPSGLKLFVPAVLTIVPGTSAGATLPTTMEYTGSPDATVARIASVTPTSSVAGYQLVLTHFSGGILMSLTPDTETSLFEAFSASHAQPNTPEGRQARAETGLRTVKWAEEHGRMDHDSATQRTADYEREWWEAEADRVRDDPALNTKIKNGDPADADTINSEIARMIEAAKRVQDEGGDASTTAIEAMGLAAEYGTNLANHLSSDPAFQATLKSGLVSDLPQITDMLGILAGLAHQAALLGNDEAAQAMIQAWNNLFQTMATAIGASCSQAPIDATLGVALTRQAALIGQEAAVAALQDCLPTPPPCPAARVPRLAIAVTAVSLGRTLAATEACVPLYLTGTLTFHTKLIHDADYPDGYVTESDTTTIQARLVLGLATAATMSFGDDGSTLTYQGDYTSPGSDLLCPYEDHRSATGTFSANNGWISATYTTGDDGSPQLIDLTYWFDSAGTHVFNGCGPDEPFVGARVDQVGCDSRDLVGLPVASSPSGTIFDFGCTNNAFTGGEVGGVSLLEISGTLTLGP